MAKKTARSVILALLAAQFGCASVPSRTQPALITAESVDRVAVPEKVDENGLKGLIAELKGKIEHYHNGDPGFKALYGRVDRLDSLRADRELHADRAQAKGMLKGAVLLPLTTLGIITIIVATTGTEGEPVGPGILFYIWFLGLIPQTLAGAGIGAVVNALGAEPVASDEMKAEIVSIVEAYNEMAAIKAKKESPGVDP